MCVHVNFGYIPIETHSLMDQKNFIKLLEKYQRGTISEEEEKLLEAFDAKLLEKNMPNVFYNPYHKRLIKSRISKEIETARYPQKPTYWTQIAATLLVILGLGIIYKLQNNTTPVVNTQIIIAQIERTTKMGEKLDLLLPDGSKVILNADSSLSYPEQFDNTTRSVTLKGEAYFDVKENTAVPFVIKTGALKTTVLGTSFNINAYEQRKKIKVTVATGKVIINDSKKNRMELLPNQQGAFEKHSRTIIKKGVKSSDFTEWKDGILKFNNMKLKDAMYKLELWYGVEISFNNEAIKNCRFTGKFNKESLETVLKSLTFAKKGLKYEFISKTKIRLKGNCTN